MSWYVLKSGEIIVIVRQKKDGLHVSYGTVQRIIPHSEAEKEFEALGMNKSFESVEYDGATVKHMYEELAILQRLPPSERMCQVGKYNLKKNYLFIQISVAHDRSFVSALKFIKAKNIKVTDLVGSSVHLFLFCCFEISTLTIISQNIAHFDTFISAVQNKETFIAKIPTELRDGRTNYYMNIYEYFKVCEQFM